MGIMTGTALLISAGVGVAAKGTGAIMSFTAANRARSAAEAAERDADKKMEEARRKLEVNFADALSINKEPYERQREAMLSAGAQALEAGVESERGGAATAGRVLAQQQEGQGQIRDEMNKDLFDLEAQKAEEDSRLRDISVGMDLQEVAGAQQAAAAFENRAAIQNTQGLNNTIGAVADGINAFTLYSKDKQAIEDAEIEQAGLDKQAQIKAAEEAAKLEADTKAAGTPAVGAGGVVAPVSPALNPIEKKAKFDFDQAIANLGNPLSRNYQPKTFVDPFDYLKNVRL